MTFLDVTGKLPIWSVQIYPDVPVTSMPTKSRLVIYPVFLIAVSYGSSSSMGFVDHIFSLTWYISPFDVASILGRYLFTSCTLSPDHDLEMSFLNCPEPC